MNYLCTELVPGAYVIAIEDKETWDVMSYTNLYVLRRGDQIILIDAGAKNYQPVIVKALAEIGITPEMVTHVLLTHGHHDHWEGAALFKKAAKYVHSADRPMVAPPLKAEFAAYSKTGPFTFAAPGVGDLEIVLVNTHSPGSVAIYDVISQALFVGDFFCYWGEDLPAGQLVTDSEAIKEGSCQYVAGQAALEEPGFDKFMQGLSRLLTFKAEFFCTGHGVVLHGEIQQFLTNMWQAGKSK